MGIQDGCGSTELTGLFDCACGVLEHAADDFDSASGAEQYSFLGQN